ncbi:MAG: response regulator [Microcoleaceae cyanobacterium]
MMHPLLQRQLKQLGLDDTVPPADLKTWQDFLEHIGQSYAAAEREQYLMEGSLTLSSREVLALYDQGRQASEARLQAERNQLQAVISALGAGFCILDLQGCLCSMNSEGEQLLGWQAEELIGQPLLGRIIPHRDLKIDSTDSSSTPFSFSDDHFVRQDGALLPVSYVLRPIWDNGQKVGVVLAFFDSSDRKRAQLEAERSLSLLQAIFDATDAGILALDKTGQVSCFNQKFTELWQIPQSLLTSTKSQSILSFVLRQLRHPPQFLKTVMQVSSEPSTPTYDILDFKDGRTFEVSSHPSKVGKKLVGRVWNFRDITERKRVEQALQHRVELEQLITNLSTHFIGLGSHEVDQGIQQALQKIGTFIGVSRGYIYLFTEPDLPMQVCYEWSIPPKASTVSSVNHSSNSTTIANAEELAQVIEGRIQLVTHHLSADDVPWISQQLNQLKGIYLSGQDLPDLAHVDLTYLQQFHPSNRILGQAPSDLLKDLQFLTIVPLINRKTLIGFLRFDTTSSIHGWSSESVNLLKMVAEMFSNAIERKRAEAALRATEAKYRGIFENAAEGIYQTTPEGRYLSANPALARILGYESTEDLIQTLTQVDQQLYVKPERHAELIAAIQNQDTVSSFESQVYRRNGQIIWISENVRAVRNLTGQIIFYEGTVADITESRQAAEALRQAKEAAVAASRAKSTFLANMSHELRTPLNAIIGYSEILSEEVVELGYGDLVSDLDRICSAGRDLLSLINDILDISKIEAGRMDLYLESFSVASLVDSVVATAQPLIDQNGNTLEVNCPDPDLVMHGDMTKVRQILLNLLSNAAKFTTAGQIGLQVELCQQSIDTIGVTLSEAMNPPEPQPCIRFQVSDTGIGMSLEQQEMLFQPFTQGDASTTRRYGGTGLGLAISHRFCQMMGGQIGVESHLDQGSIFTVVLPQQVRNPVSEVSGQLVGHSSRLSESYSSEDYSPATVSSPNLTPTEPSSGNPQLPKTVLVIDDDPISRDLVTRSLIQAGLRVLTAATGEAGLEIARTSCPDVITLDIMMPSMDGWSVLSTLKADTHLAEIPVIVISFLSNRAQGIALGASDYLTKPIDGKRLVALLNRYQQSEQSSSLTTNSQEILIVEDHEDTRQLLRDCLEQDGWQVAEAGNGQVALDYLKHHQPCLIVLDLLLPRVSGFELITELQQSSALSQIPVIVTTAADLNASERSRLRESVERILQKGSYSNNKLLKEIHQLVVSTLEVPNLPFTAEFRTVNLN